MKYQEEHNRIALLTFFVVLIISVAVGFTLWVYFFRNQPFSLGNVQRQERPEDVVGVKDLVASIEDWGLYKEDPTVEVGTGKCGNPVFEIFLEKTNEGSRRILRLGDQLLLVITPNYEGWTNEVFLKLKEDSSVFCSAGGIYPLRAYLDKLLWKGRCSSGAIPSVNSPVYSGFTQCLKVEEAVEDMFDR